MKSDVDSAVNPCCRFFVLEVEGRIVAAGVKELGIEELEEMSQCVPDQTESWSKAKKKDFPHDLSAKIVDKYVLDKARHEKIALAINQLEEKHLQKMKDKTPNRRFSVDSLDATRHFHRMENGDTLMSNLTILRSA